MRRDSTIFLFFLHFSTKEKHKGHSPVRVGKSVLFCMIIYVKNVTVSVDVLIVNLFICNDFFRIYFCFIF